MAEGDVGGGAELASLNLTLISSLLAVGTLLSNLNLNLFYFIFFDISFLFVSSFTTSFFLLSSLSLSDNERVKGC